MAGRIADGLGVAIAGILAPVAGAPHVDPLVILATALLTVHVLAAAGLLLDDASARCRRSAAGSAILAGVAVAVGGSLLPLMTGEVSPIPVAWSGMTVALLAVSQGIWGQASAVLARSSRKARRVLVVGDRDRALDVLATIAGAEQRWAFPVGVLLDRDAPQRPTLGGFISALEDAESVVRQEMVDGIVVAIPWSDPQRLTACLQKLKPLAVDVHLFPEDAELFVAAGTSVMAGVPMVTLRTKPLAEAAALVKAVEDRILGTLLLLLALPVMAVVAMAIKLDSPGPVLFRQKRYGYDNQPFTCFKFRSMAVRTEEADVKQASRNDPRVTRVGRFIRRTSLDELPQLLNVIGGTMSLVGPRPHAMSHHHLYEKVVDDYRCRHRMKPGITGWAQVNGFRGETATVEAMRKRVVHDLWYIDHWSLSLDLIILARTPFACVKGTNAY